MVIALLMLATSVALYLFAPGHYSHNYCIWLLAVYVGSTIWFIRRSLYGNYLNFHLLFFISYFFVNFVYPVFLYPADPYYFHIFELEFNHNVISKSTALALLGSSSYILGATYMQKRKVKKTTSSNEERPWFSKISILLQILSGIAFILFLLLVGRAFFLGIFNSYSSSSVYFLITFQTLIALTLIVSFLSKRDSFAGTFMSFMETFNKPLLIFSFLFVLLFFYIGDRGPALQVLIIIATLYSIFVKPIKLKGFILSAGIGLFVLAFISYARVKDPSDVAGSHPVGAYFERGFENLKLDSFFDLGRDLIVNDRNLFKAVELTEQAGINYGKTMLSQIVAVVPGAGALIDYIFNTDIKRLSFSKLLTELENSNAGLGGNIIGDIYISFGTVGVLCFMLFFGYINMKFQVYSIQTDNLYYFVAYIISMSYSLYYPRASFFIAFRVILWPIFLLMMLKHIIPGKKASEANRVI